MLWSACRPAVLERMRTLTDNERCVFWKVSTEQERPELRPALRPRSASISAILRQRPHLSLWLRHTPAPDKSTSPRLRPHLPHVYRAPHCHVCHVSHAPLRQHPHYVYPPPRFHLLHVYPRQSFLRFVGYVCHVRSSSRVRARFQLSVLCCGVFPCTRVTPATFISRARYSGTGMRIRRGTWLKRIKQAAHSAASVRARWPLHTTSDVIWRARSTSASYSRSRDRTRQ